MNISTTIVSSVVGDLVGLTSDQQKAECREVHKFNSTWQCSFVNSNPDCYVDEGLIQYILFIYCSFRHNLIPLSITILVIWLLFLFIAVAVAADNFFCPSLEVIARLLRMSDNIAGVTLMAFGNGAPDVFSAISAVDNMKDGDVGMAFGALLGAGVFLTTVVAGAVTLVGPFHAMERPFLRDVIFYIGTVFFTFFVCYDGVITVYESLGYIAAYAVYVVIVVFGRLIFQYLKRLRHLPGDRVTEVHSNGSITVTEDTETQTETDEHTPLLRNNYISQVASSRNDVEEEDEEQLHQRSALADLLHAISPIDVDEWRTTEDKYYLTRISAVFKAPALFILKLTVPVVDYKSRRHNWNKPLSVLQCLITPVFCVFAASYPFALRELGAGFPVWAIFLIVGFILAVIVMFTSRRETPPVYHPAYAFIGFISAVLWIKNIANEIVNILQAGGVVFNISNTLLGLTLLAWGNSIPDLISDVAMAKRGLPRAGLSACFGGPLFNTLLGVGIPFTVTAYRQGAPTAIKFTAIQSFLFIGLAVSLISSLIIVPLMRFRLNRRYGFYLFSVYVVFFIFTLLIESDVIRWKV